MHRLVALIALVFATIAPSATAQDATPVGNVPGPEECRVAPRPAAMLAGTPSIELVELEARLDATPVPADTLPTGEPADRATVDGIDATVRELVACVHAADRDRLLSLFSDDFRAIQLIEFGLLEVYALEEVPIGTPVAEEERMPVPPVGDVRMLDDGRVGAIVGDPEDEAAEEPLLFVVFVEAEGRWLIDEVVPVVLDEVTTRPIQGNDFLGVIVPERLGDAFYFPFFGEHAAGYWTPTEADVRALEAEIETFLGQDDVGAAAAAPDLLDRLPTYFRQYVGIGEDGRRLIFANFFCDTLGADWTAEAVSVDDGGECFFRLRFDVERGVYSELQVNGEA